MLANCCCQVGKFIKKIKGCRIDDIYRRGKAIIIRLIDLFPNEGDFSNYAIGRKKVILTTTNAFSKRKVNKACGYLVIQLKMTGQLIYGEDLKTIENLKETKVTFKLSDGHYLNYNDQRLFGRLSFVKRLEDHPYLQSIGIEPLSDGFNAEWLKKELKQRKTPVKMLLMKQEFLAGIGNIYASEILFHARIHPKKSARTLNVSQVQSLCVETKDILKRAIKFRGSSMRNYRDSFGEKGRFMSQIKVYGRENEACFNCKTPITRIVQGARSTFFCKKCQH